MSTNYLFFTITGHISSVDGVCYLLTSDGTRFKVKAAPTEIPPGMNSWQVIPSTSTDGAIASITLEDQEKSDSSSQCLVGGRVVLLGKKGKFVQLKVARPGQKTLRISISGSDRRMKVGQLWEVVAHRQGDRLVLEKAHPIEQSSPPS